MTAPGKNLEFTLGPVFKKRVQTVPHLAESVVSYLAHHPPATLQGNGVAAFEMAVEDKVYGVVCRRLGQTVSLLGIYTLPYERQVFERRFADWQVTYGPPRRRGS